MASNFWTSSHRAQLQSEEQVNRLPAELCRGGMTPRQYQQIKHHYCRKIFEMVARMGTVRLRVATTACAYFHRFYGIRTFLQHDPRFLVPTCVYLASKVEENLWLTKDNKKHPQYTKQYMSAAMELDTSLQGAITTKMLLEHELHVVQAFDCDLILFSAHTDLATILTDMRKHECVRDAFPADAGGSDSRADKPRFIAASWSLVCDAYCTSACALEPPFTIALAAALLAAELLGIDCSEWLKGVLHDRDGVMRVSALILQSHDDGTLAQAEVLDILRTTGVIVS